MKIIICLLIFINLLFSNSQNLSFMNSIKQVIQKEEYIALAVNKYILQTGKIPLVENSNKLNWDLLKGEDYLGSNFNKTNPFTSKDMNVVFDSTNNCYILGVLENIEDYKSKNEYLYNFYINKLFRVNTTPPKDNSSTNLLKGSQIVYSKLQKEIVDILNKNTDKIILETQQCPANEYYYELKFGKLTYKYCKNDYTSLEVYQNPPIYLEDINDLVYIKANIGDKAYVKNNGSWFEYYYQGEVNKSWVPLGTGSILTSKEDEIDVIDRVLSYIPNAKDLVIRRDGGCMLANGDIFCWGNNQYKKAGIETFGQLNPNLAPDYVNTPVMLRVQIDNTEKVADETGNEYSRRDKSWYNNPYRIKFEKMSMNSTNVCAISPIFNFFDSGEVKKFGGDLYCNGQISSNTYEDMQSSVSQTSILKRNKFFSIGKSDKTDDDNENEIYLKDIVMVEDTIAVLSDAGKIYTLGKNYKGALGIGSDDKFLNKTTAVEVLNEGQVFKKIFALRDIKTFGAIDSNNLFWIWGTRPNGVIYNKPTLLDTSKKFDPDAIFVNSNEFILKGIDKNFYKTTGSKEFVQISTIVGEPLSISVFNDGTTEHILYINEDFELKGSSSLLNCRDANEISTCDSSSNELFTLALNQLNSKNNTINGKDYAHFSNVSIFKLDHVINEVFEDFENGASGWSNNSVTNVTDDGSDEIPVTSFLGRFTIGSEVQKTFSFGLPNKEVEIEFDFYEIDTWDYERFIVELNDEKVVEDAFIHDDHPELTDTNDTGEALQAVGSSGIVTNDGDEKYHYKLKTKLDSSGNLKIKFRTRALSPSDEGYNVWAYAQPIYDEAWGIDNLHIKVKESDKKFVCAMTGIGVFSQMYCWGNVARSIPILNTSLYDVNKVATINELFVNEEKDRKKDMAFDEYFQDGKLFLKYPTYIGGFDYEFYFK